MSACVSHIDTCGIMMLVNPKDDVRKRIGIGSKKAEDCLPRNSNGFRIAMPALGECVHMIRVRCHDNRMDILSEVDRLIENGFFDVSFLKDPQSTFTVARELSKHMDDARDRISPMDAFILASAITDENCDTLYTSDKKLQYNQVMWETINGWREEHGLGDFKVADLQTLVR